MTTTPFDECKHQRVQLSVGNANGTIKKEVEVLAWTTPNFAAHRGLCQQCGGPDCADYYIISSLPEGLSLLRAGAIFPTLEQAVTAMVELERECLMPVATTERQLAIFGVCHRNGSMVRDANELNELNYMLVLRDRLSRMGQ